MANSDFLRHNLNQHVIKNSKSKKMDKDIIVATEAAIMILKKKYPQLTFRWQKTMPLTTIIKDLGKLYPQYKNELGDPLESSFISPDGGFLFAKKPGQEEKLILVSEVKRQGTNDARKQEGLKKQALGNAIERLGKNLIGIRVLFKNRKVIPFICFGHGYDFAPGSSILDRVLTMNEFFPLNKIFVKKEYEPFEPVSMFFRYPTWTAEEMTNLLVTVATESIETDLL